MLEEFDRCGDILEAMDNKTPARSLSIQQPPAFSSAIEPG